MILSEDHIGATIEAATPIVDHHHLIVKEEEEVDIDVIAVEAKVVEDKMAVPKSCVKVFASFAESAVT